MIWEKVRSAILLYAAPGLLCGVAAIQRYLMDAHHLDPWKGGGFGMFSTGGRNRQITINFLISDGKNIRISDEYMSRHIKLDSTVPKRIREALVMPSSERLHQLARELADCEWVLVKDPKAGTEYPVLKRDIREGAPYRPLALKEVQVEVWDYRFESSGPRLQLVQLVTVVEQV